MAVQVTSQGTPNPNAMKFTVSETLTAGSSKTFNSAAEAAADPLAARLFEVAGVRAVFLLNNFITITRLPEVDWATITPEVEKAIQQHFEK